jgi:rhamnosyltransferase
MYNTNSVYMPSIEQVCAVVVTYNIGSSYINNFNSICEQVDKIIIVDNGSTNDTIPVLEQLSLMYTQDKLEVIVNGYNVGLATAQNIGVRKALELGYEWILLLDHDSNAAPGMVEAMLSHHNANQVKPPLIMGPAINELSTTEMKPNYIALTNGRVRRLNLTEAANSNDLLFIISSGSLIHASVFNRIGFLNDDFFIDYVDIEFCLRARMSNINISVVENAVLYHRLGNVTIQKCKFFSCTFVTTNHCPLRRAYIYRNRLKVWRTYLFAFPLYVAYDVAASCFGIFKIISFESNKAKKFAGIMLGMWLGIINHKGKIPLYNWLK